MKKKILILALAILIIAVGAVAYFIIQQKGEEGLKEDKHEYLLTSKKPKLEGIDIESIIEYEDHYILGVHHPVTENEEINKIINDFVQGHIAEFKENAKEFFEEPPPPGGFSSWKYELNIDYEVNRPSKEIVCFKFNINLFTGGGGIQFIETFSFNLETGKELTLKDVFEEKSDYLNFISELSIKQLTERLFDSGKVEKTLFAEDWVKDGASPTEENFRNFSLKDNSIIFYFEKYQVVAGAFGQQQVEISFDHLKEVLNPEITKNPIKIKKPGEVILLKKPPNVEVGGTKIVALTFDDGPHPINTLLILEELKKRNAVATFFVVGNRVQYYPEVLARVIAEGSEIGNHTWSHKQLTTLSPEGIKKQVNDTQKAVKNAIGITPKIFRTPYGEVSELIAQNVGLPIILWSVDTEDWKNKDREIIIAHIIAETDNGEIVLQHDLYLWSVEAVGPALDDLINKGYKFVTVSQLLGFIDNPTKATPGEVFRFRQLLTK